MGEASRVAKESLDAFNAHDEERIRACHAPSVSFEAPGDVRLTGPDDVTEYTMSWLRAFPDAEATIENEIEAGDWVVYELTLKGTHKGALVSPGREIPATNRGITSRAAQTLRIQDGKVAEEHLYWDQVQILTQLGLMPEAQVATA
jgi:steroid delta-isomerase-like uncharacterized protein